MGLFLILISVVFRILPYMDVGRVEYKANGWWKADSDFPARQTHLWEFVGQPFGENPQRHQ